MPDEPRRRYQLARSEEYLGQLRRLVDTGSFPSLKHSLPGVLYAIETRAEVFPKVLECNNLRGAKSDGAGVDPPFTVWFDLDGGLVTLRGITYFDIPSGGLWDGD